MRDNTVQPTDKETAMNMLMSQHALYRAADRAVSDEDIKLTVTWGEEIRQEGVTCYFMGEKQASQLAKRGVQAVKNVAVVVADDTGEVVSVIKTADRRRLLKTRTKRHKRRSCVSMPHKRELARIQ